jgi:hypothetical protein
MTAPPPPSRTPLRTARPSVADLMPKPAEPVRPAVEAAGSDTKRRIVPPRPLPGALPVTPPARLSVGDRLKRALFFWKSWSDPVACTLLTPSGLLPGETTTVQVVLHHANRSEQAKTLPDWRGTLALPQPLGRGEAVGLNLSLQGVDVSKPLNHIDWHGYSAAALFTFRVPPEWPAGQPVQGALTVGRHQVASGKLEFTLPVAATQPVG